MNFRPQSVFRALLVGSFLLLSLLVLAQEEENSRRFWPPNYRPAGESATTAAKPKPPSGTYKRVTPPRANRINEQPLLNATEVSALGVTLWRLRPETPAEAKQADLGRILVTVNGERKSWIPERVEASTRFAYGDLMRISIETPRSGYLYVVDREEYADGTLGVPQLVFPQNPAKGGHQVSAGRVIELPNQNDAQAVFQFDPPDSSTKTVANEWLTFLVTPAPLTDLPAAQGDEPIKLDPAKVKLWEEKYGQAVEQLELQKSAGRSYTAAEKKAGASAQGKLKPEDPLPQTVFRIAAKPGTPFAVRMPLLLGKK